LYAGHAVPGINEPHYWTKAAHFWNSEFGKFDLFLESGDAHWLFFATFGYLTKFMSLPAAVWTGRFITWMFLALGWTMLGRSLWLTAAPRNSAMETGSFDKLANSPQAPMFSSCWALVWLAGLHYGHWAGEWVVGGCESKGIAYAFIFAGLALVIRQRWTLAWTLFGFASAFHVVIGIWVIACVACVSFFTDRGVRSNDSMSRSLGRWLALHRWGWTICMAGVVAGAVPALAIDWGTDPVLAGQSAVKQVYTRLGHHLAPSRFNWIRWRDFGVQLVFACILGRMAMLSKVAFNQDANRDQANRFPRGLQLVIGWGFFGFAVALIGLTIDLTFGSSFPLFAAKILRFYLFRWNDVAMPMMVGALATSFAYGLITLPLHPKGARFFAWLYVFVPGAILLATRFESNLNEIIPSGDKAHFVAKTDSEAKQIKQFDDWLRVCEWIRNNSDEESLWLTPRRQQSFKWHTGRPELACWKDAPQNAEAVVAWSQRLADAYQFDKTKILQPWTTDKLWELHTKYGIRYVLLDLRVVGQTPPLLPILYPSPNEFNETFAVFELSPQKANVSR